jgi:hypothetical protein
MNLDDGSPIAKIVRVNEDKKRKMKEKIIYVSDQLDDPDNVNEIRVKTNESVQHIPNFHRERDILYVVGASGSGKSHYSIKFINEYKKIFPKRKIWVISSLSNDPTLDSSKAFKRIRLDEDFLECPLSVEDFKNSLVLFDDTDCIKNKAIKMKIDGLLNILLETGRHVGATIIYISHIACKGNDTKTILNECHSVTFFVKSCGNRTLKYLLDSYFGLDKKQIERIKKLKSRWITVCKTYPMVVMYEKGIYVLNSD